MIVLRTLGAAELEEERGSEARPIGVQAKRLTLLAYLALAGRGRQSRRDRRVAVFWPELDDKHARAALRQSLSYLRRTLGAPVLATRGEEEIAVAPHALRCDAVQFDEAAAAGRCEEAMALYRGDFLDGLFVSDASAELEGWVEQERSRLRRAAVLCAVSLASAGRDRGDGEAAAAWGRQAVALAPDDEPRLRWFVELLDAIGDRAGAVEAYDRFARRLAAEYGVEPSAETQALMRTVRARSAAAAVAASHGAAPTGDPTRRSTGPSPHDTRVVAPPLERPRWPAARATAGVAGTLALVVIAAVIAPMRVGLDRAPRVAVLPVRELTRDDAEPYLADALTEELIADLARSPTLRVVDRRTVLGLRGTDDLRDAARTLDASLALASSLRRTGDSVHLAVRLVRARDGGVDWAWSRQAPSGDLFRLAREIADSVAALALGSKRADRRLSSAAPRRVDPVALEFYVRGRHWWNRRGPGLLRAIQLFGQALDQDPSFARAYSGIGDAYVQLGYGSLLRPDDAFPKARAAAERALALDSTLAEPHATLGFVALYYEWDWPRAEREFRRALALDAGYATGREWYGLFLAAMGRFDEAREQERRAQALDPLSPALAGTAAWILYYAGRHEEAERELRVALRVDSTFALGRFYLGRVHEARGRPDSALAAYRAAGPLRDWVPTIAAVGHVYGTQGRLREARAVLATLDSLSRTRYVTAYAVALVYASIGQRDSAFAWLERGLAERTHWMVWLRQDPRWAPIRTDPRFEALASRLGLPRRGAEQRVAGMVGVR